MDENREFISKRKLSLFDKGLEIKGPAQIQEEELKAKRDREENEIKEVYEDFVASFQDDVPDSKRRKTFVKRGVLMGSREEANPISESSTRDNSTTTVKEKEPHTKKVKVALEDEQISIDTRRSNQRRRNMDSFLKDLKKSSQRRDEARKADRIEYRLDESESRVVVMSPIDREVLHAILLTSAFVARFGSLFEEKLLDYERKNRLYRFLFDKKTQEHIYYRWKVYSLTEGDQMSKWSTKPFQMYEKGPIWYPPHEHDVDVQNWKRLYSKLDDILPKSRLKQSLGFSEGDTPLPKGIRGALDKVLDSLDISRISVGDAMVMCLENASSSKEIVGIIEDRILKKETPIFRKVACLFLVSDILHNSAESVKNASSFRLNFEIVLQKIFQHFSEIFGSIQGRMTSSILKNEILSVFASWRKRAMYPEEVLEKLSASFGGIEAVLRFENNASEDVKSRRGKGKGKAKEKDKGKPRHEIQHTDQYTDVDGGPVDFNLFNQGDLHRIAKAVGLGEGDGSHEYLVEMMRRYALEV